MNSAFNSYDEESRGQNDVKVIVIGAAILANHILV